MIAATRYKYLDKETNVPIQDFFKLNSNDILSNASLEIGDLSASLQASVTNFTQDLKIDIPKLDKKLLDGIDEKIPKDLKRNAKDLFSSIRDISKLSSKDVDLAIAEFIPGNTQAQNAFTQLSQKCKTKGMGRGSKFGKPYDTNIDCNGKKKKGNRGGCNVNGYGNVLNKLTNGKYNAKSQDLNKMLSNLVALTNFGYSMNMCGVFNALKDTDLGKNVLSRASASIFGNLNSNKNILGTFDLAGASAGLHTLKELPSALKGMFASYKTPKGVKQKEFASITDRITGSAEIFDSKWNKSKHDGMKSISVMNTYNPKLNDVFKSKVMGNTFNESQLGSVVKGQFDTIAASYKKASKFDNALKRLAA